MARPVPSRPNRPIRISAALAAVALLAACASQREAQEAVSAQRLLVGMPVGTLLSCAGVPDGRQVVDASEFLTYRNVEAGRSGGSSLGVGVGGGGGNLGLGLGLGIPLGGGRSSGCVATFTVEEGRVTGLTYREDADDTSACYAIVENCLALVPGRQ